MTPASISDIQNLYKYATQIHSQDIKHHPRNQMNIPQNYWNNERQAEIIPETSKKSPGMSDFSI